MRPQSKAVMEILSVRGRGLLVKVREFEYENVGKSMGGCMNEVLVQRIINP